MVGIKIVLVVMVILIFLLSFYAFYLDNRLSILEGKMEILESERKAV